jgi:hypothetical protein
LNARAEDEAALGRIYRDLAERFAGLLEERARPAPLLLSR